VGTGCRDALRRGDLDQLKLHPKSLAIILAVSNIRAGRLQMTSI